MEVSKILKLIAVGLFSFMLAQTSMAEDDEELIMVDEYLGMGKEPFKVNLSGKGDHVMVLRIKTYITTQKAVDGFKLHLPKIKSDILSLLSEQTYKGMRSKKKKKKLKQKILTLIRGVLKERGKIENKERLESVAEILFPELLLQ
ncbi:MAG: hypothetical protein HOM84_07830 [Thiotrichales bacterium]|nr:hypothetical protein [Thiotrichales bacterium]MBT4261984.1 hypothetical protein [Thiotrichales bacterium]MBT4972436.1 hypothetical protein [Thiotrichales bacterium]MBT5290841.1 hypothetical protein [Thiotrichales bacterium]MBT5418233.1 hypothetical protein [Thiotrichales bacterium]